MCFQKHLPFMQVAPCLQGWYSEHSSISSLQSMPENPFAQLQVNLSKRTQQVSENIKHPDQFSNSSTQLIIKVTLAKKVQYDSIGCKSFNIYHYQLQD